MGLVANFQVDVIYTESGSSLKLLNFTANILDLIDFDPNQNKMQPLSDPGELVLARGLVFSWSLS